MTTTAVFGSSLVRGRLHPMRPTGDDASYYEFGPEAGASRRTPRGRFSLVLAVLGVLMLVASVVGAIELGRLNTSMDQLVERISQRTVLATRIKQEFLLLRVAEKNIILEETPAGMEVFEGRAVTARGRLLDLLDQLKTVSDDTTDQRAREFAQSFREYDAKLAEVKSLARTDSLQRAAAISRGHGHTLYELARQTLGTIIRQCMSPTGESGAGALGPAVAASDALHELAYLEQALFTTFSHDDSAQLAERETAANRALGEAMDQLRAALPSTSGGELDSLASTIKAWSEAREQVRELALANTRQSAMELSNTALRETYLRSADQLDSIVLANEEVMQSVKTAHSQTVAMGRALLVVTGLAGLAVALGLVLMLLGQLLRELRRAGESISLES